MLWFGNTLSDLLINPNQLRAYGLLVKDDPFNANEFGIDADEDFTQFDTKGTIVYVNSHVPTDWETTLLPIIILTTDTWDPKTVNLISGRSSHEEAEMRIVRSLTSGMNRCTVSAVRQEQSVSRQVRFGQFEQQLMKILSTFDERTFCKRLIGKVNIASTYREDVDGWTENRSVSSIDSNDRHSHIGPEELARKCNVGIQTAKDNLDITTQHGVCTAVQPMTRQLRVHHLHLNRPLLRGTWLADTLISKVKSIKGNKCTNIFMQGKFTKVVPMTERSESGQLLVNFTDNVGIPEDLVADGAGEFTCRETEFAKEACRMRIRLHTSEQGRKNQNQAVERTIGFLAKCCRAHMHKKKVPKRLWDFGLVYESEMLLRMVCGRDLRTGYEEVTGDTPYISEWIDFEMYDLVYWIDRPKNTDTSDDVRRFGRWICISHHVGSDMFYWLITDSGKLVYKLWCSM